jgi:shikimate dehydrogenase
VAARKAAVLGSPIAHSLSPALHRAAYAKLGLDGWSYQAIECDEAGLPGWLAGCGPQWAGLSLTMPLKQAVLPLLTDAEPLVSQVGAANTLIFADGRRLGYNTDVGGMVAALAEAGTGGAGAARDDGAGGAGPARDGAGGAGPAQDGAAGTGPAQDGAAGTGAAQDRAAGRLSPALILGGGSTAAAALAALARLGVREAVVAVRDPGRAEGLLATAARLGMHVHCRAFGLVDLAGVALLISAVPATAGDEVAGQLLATPRPPGIVFDVSYDPWPSRLADAARRRGAVLVSGLELLVHQAARQFELMTGRPAPLPVMHAAGQAELRRRGAGG